MEGKDPLTVKSASHVPTAIEWWIGIIVLAGLIVWIILPVQQKSGSTFTEGTPEVTPSYLTMSEVYKSALEPAKKLSFPDIENSRLASETELSPEIRALILIDSQVGEISKLLYKNQEQGFLIKYSLPLKMLADTNTELLNTLIGNGWEILSNVTVDNKFIVSDIKINSSVARIYGERDDDGISMVIQTISQ